MTRKISHLRLGITSLLFWIATSIIGVGVFFATVLVLGNGDMDLGEGLFVLAIALALAGLVPVPVCWTAYGWVTSNYLRGIGASRETSVKLTAAWASAPGLASAALTVILTEAPLSVWLLIPAFSCAGVAALAALAHPKWARRGWPKATPVAAGWTP